MITFCNIFLILLNIYIFFLFLFIIFPLSFFLFLDQLKNVFQLKGKAEKTDPFLVRFWNDMTNGGSVHWPTFGIAILTIAAAIAIRQLNKRFKLGLPELFIILTIALIIFGPRKLPELGRSLGRSLSEFKKASHELRMLAKERWEQVTKAVAALPDRQRLVFTLCHLDERTPAEISASTGMNQATVRVHLFRALRKLRGVLGGKA